MPVLRSKRRGESRGCGTGLPGAPEGSAVGPVAEGVADPPEAGGALGLEGPGYYIRQEHYQGSQEEAVVEHMTPPMRPPPRRTRRAGQEDRHRRPQQQRLFQSLTRSSTRTDESPLRVGEESRLDLVPF